MTGMLLSGTLWVDYTPWLINAANGFLHRWEFGVVGVKKLRLQIYEGETSQCTAFSGNTSRR